MVKKRRAAGRNFICFIIFLPDEVPKTRLTEEEN
jgi:hypothetical protein